MERSAECAIIRRSMALRVFISYSHDSQEHMDAVWELSERLRGDGVDCRIDQHEESPAEGWPRWCRNQVQEAQFVLVACTETYKRRYEGKEAAGVGRGGQWEGFVITEELYEAEGKNEKFIPIVFSPTDKPHIPMELRAFTYYEPAGDGGYQKLFRRITGQPEKIPSPVAAGVRVAPPVGVHPKAGLETTPVPALERKSPSAKPQQIFTVPLPENPFFTGREEALDGVKASLEERGIAALTGMGGVGKTQTAAQYAHRHRNEYPAVLWVRAESLETLFADLTQLAGRLELPEREAKEQSLVLDAVKRWLDEQERWLVVLDNVEDYGIVRDLTGKAGPGGHHVVVTTQMQPTGTVARHRLSPMQRDQGALLLLRRANRLAAGAGLSDTDPQQATLAREISDEVQGLPLALDQAGAYIEETSCGLQDYLTLLRRRSGELLDRRGGLDPEHSDHVSVSKTLVISFEKLRKLNPASAELLQAMAFLPPDEIPEEIFTEGAAEFSVELSAAAADELKWNGAIGATLKYSLVERNPEKKLLAVHRTVQVVLKARMSAEERKQCAEQAVRAVNAVFPRVEFSTWPKCERLTPSAQVCAGLVEEYDLSMPEAARLLNQAGVYLKERARYSEAEPLYRRALIITEKALGLDHPKVAIRLINLAALLQDTNRLGEAEPLKRRALEIDEKAYGPNHPEVATDINNLALLLKATNRLGEAEPLMKRVIEIFEKAYGQDHPKVATSLNNLAQLLKATNRLAEAEPLMRRALEIDQKALGPDHPNVAIRLNNLAQLLQATHRLGEAEPLLRRALEIDEKSYGPDHPDVARDLNNLAGLLYATNRVAEAEPLMRRALAIDEKAYGPDHPDVAIDLNNLAQLLRATNRLVEAEPLMRRALKIDEKAYGRVPHSFLALE
ncbi:MAG: tetratricopeptide repeat protein [Candidatus Korobacteraceae bacterium]